MRSASPQFRHLSSVVDAFRSRPVPNSSALLTLINDLPTDIVLPHPVSLQGNISGYPGGTFRVVSRNLAPHFVGPFPVSKVINPPAVRLRLPSSMRIHPTFNFSKIKPVNESLLQPSTRPPPSGFPACPLLDLFALFAYNSIVLFVLHLGSNLYC